jgi:hypothetical protein
MLDVEILVDKTTVENTDNSIARVIVRASNELVFNLAVLIRHRIREV